MQQLPLRFAGISTPDLTKPNPQTKTSGFILLTELRRICKIIPDVPASSDILAAIQTIQKSFPQI
jgi:hypothetical protein